MVKRDRTVVALIPFTWPTALKASGSRTDIPAPVMAKSATTAAGEAECGSLAGHGGIPAKLSAPAARGLQAAIFGVTLTNVSLWVVP